METNRACVERKRDEARTDAYAAGRSPREVQDVGCSDKERFQLELEFVQCLANPHYVNRTYEKRRSDLLQAEVLPSADARRTLVFSETTARPRPKQVLRRSCFRELSSLPTVLEAAQICQVHSVRSDMQESMDTMMRADIPSISSRDARLTRGSFRRARYPHALYFLDALQDPEFRRAMVHSDFKEYVHKQQYFYWRYHQENVVKELLAKAHKKAAMEPSHTQPTE